MQSLLAGERGLEGPGNFECVPLRAGRAWAQHTSCALPNSLHVDSGVTASCPARTDRPGSGRKLYPAGLSGAEGSWPFLHSPD